MRLQVNNSREEPIMHALPRAVLAGIAMSAIVATSVVTASADNEEIIVGFAESKSGWMAAYSGPAALAAKMKIAEINAAGGLLGKQIQTVDADAKTDRSEGAKAGQQVIGDGADFVIVDCDFDFGAPAANMAQGAGLISFFLCAGDPKAGIEGIGIYAFSGGNAAHVDGAAMATWAYENKGSRKAYLLRDETIEYSQSTCAGFEWQWPQLEGAEIIGIDVFQNEDPSIQGQIDRLRSSPEQPDVIALCSYIPGGASAIRQIRAAGIDTLIMGGIAMDGTYWLDAVPNLSNFCVAAFGSIYGDAPEPELSKFIADYTAAKGEGPATAYPLTGYAVIELWSRAVERAGTVATDPVLAELEKMTGEKTIIGPRGFSDQLHIQDTARYAILCTENGEPRFQEYWTAGPVPKDVLLKN